MKLKNKFANLIFFKIIFLKTKTSMQIVFKIFFLIFSNIKIVFAKKKLI